MTFADVADGIDRLAQLADHRLDLSRVVVIGHSAGGQLALWAAGRHRAPEGAVGSRPRIQVRAVIGLAPVTDLSRAGAQAVALLGGGPTEVPGRWAQADPVRLAPPPVPTLLVHPDGDRTIPVSRSMAYADLCRRAGADITVVAPAHETHSDPIDPSSLSWRAAAAWLDELRPEAGPSSGSR